MTAFTVVEPHLEFGGAERQTVLLLNRLVARGVECHLILHEARGGLLGDLDQRVTVWDLKLESHLAIPLTAHRLRQTLGQLPPSFVVIKLWSSILACAAIDRGFPQHTFSYCEDLDPSDHARYIRLGRVKQAIIKRIFRRRPHLTANTSSVADSMVETYGLTTRPEVISSVVDPPAIVERWQATEPLGVDASGAATSGVVKVCSVGTLITRKGLEVTFKAVDRLSKTTKVEWHVVGEGPLRTWLEECRSRSDSQLEIVLHGGNPNPYPVIAGCDALVHSALSEAFGIVILEALALGVHVIASDAIGPTEMTEVLGPDPRFLQLYPIGEDEVLSSLLESLGRHVDRPSREQFQDYIASYTLDSTVDKWQARAARLTTAGSAV